jgi:hypothetical protein
MPRSLPALLASCLLLALPAAASAADSIGVQDGVLTYTADPAATGAELRIGSLTTGPCQFLMPDGSTYRAGPCLVLQIGDRGAQGPRAAGVTVGAGCTAVGRDDAVCPFDGVERIALRTGPGADDIRFDEVYPFSRFLAGIPTDTPTRVPVPISLDLGGGDDQLLQYAREFSIPQLDLSCGDGHDTLTVPAYGLRWNLDCEAGDGFEFPAPRTKGGSLRRDGGVLRFVTTPPDPGFVLGLDYGYEQFRGNDMIGVDGPSPQELDPGCLVYGRHEQGCPAEGVERMEIVAPRDEQALVYLERPDRGERRRPPATLLLGDRADELQLADGSSQHVSCGGGLDTVVAGPEDTLEADCESVKGGRRQHGADVRIAPRSVWRRDRDDVYVNRVPLQVTCPAAIGDETCGGKVALTFRGARMGSMLFSIPRGRRARLNLALGRGSVGFGGELARGYASMRRAIRDSGGAAMKATVTSGSSTFVHRVTLTRLVTR